MNDSLEEDLNEIFWNTSMNGTSYVTSTAAANSSDDMCPQTTFDEFRACVKMYVLSSMAHMSFTQATIFTFAYGCISFLGMLGNGLVIFVVIRQRRMRTNRNVFIVNLALSNFFLAAILLPFLWLPAYRIDFPYGEFMCKLANSFPAANIFCSSLTISVISVDRYFAVVRARPTSDRAKALRSTCISVFIWILSFLVALPYLLYFKKYEHLFPNEIIPPQFHDQVNGNLTMYSQCDLRPEPCAHYEGNELNTCLRPYEITVTVLMAVFIYFVPVPVLLVFTFLLTRFLAHSDHKHSLLRNRCPPETLLLSDRAGDSQSGSTRGPPGRQLSKPTESVLSAQNSKKRSRTTTLLFAMACVNAVLWLPFIAVSLVLTAYKAHEAYKISHSLRQLDEAGKLISMLSICVNPFLYGYLNTNFNREFKTILRRCSPCPRLNEETCTQHQQDTAYCLSEARRAYNNEGTSYVRNLETTTVRKALMIDTSKL